MLRSRKVRFYPCSACFYPDIHVLDESANMTSKNVSGH